MKGLVWGAALACAILSSSMARADPAAEAETPARTICGGGRGTEVALPDMIPQRFRSQYPDAVACLVTLDGHRSNGFSRAAKAIILYINALKFKSDTSKIVASGADDSLNLYITLDENGKAIFLVVTLNDTGNKFAAAANGTLQFFASPNKNVDIKFHLSDTWENYVNGTNPSDYTWRSTVDSAIRATASYPCDGTKPPTLGPGTWPFGDRELNDNGYSLTATIPNVANTAGKSTCYFYQAYLISPYGSQATIDPIIVNHGTPPAFRSRRGAGQPPS
jgi:hypothetical protein